MKIKENSYNISEVFDVRISLDHWQKIQYFADFHKVTFSWITRFCVFRLLKKYKIKPLAQLTSREKEIRESELIHSHRLQLCLYGEDALSIRIAAAKSGYTISQFVRIALQAFLCLLNRYYSDQIWVIYGTKYILQVMEIRHSYEKNFYTAREYWPKKAFVWR